MASRVALVSLLLAVHGISAHTARRDPPELKVISADIAIVGGGASGTFAAVRLREDFNKSVVLIEPMQVLGGAANTYFVPETNTTVDYGVQSYQPNGPATDFFARFGIAPQPLNFKDLTTVNVNVETGEELKGYSPPSLNATNDAFQRWLEIVSQYEALLEPDYWNFPQPSEIPAEFLVPFEEFAKLHQLEAAVPRIVAVSGVGYGGVRNLTTFDVIQALGASFTKDMLAGTQFRQSGYNGLLYERALDLLGPDVLLSSRVEDVKITSSGVELLVRQGDAPYVIIARRVLYTAPPSLRNLAPFQPDEKETAVLSTLDEHGEFVGVISAPCLPENYAFSYLPSAVVPSNQLAVKDWPYSLRIDSTGPPGLGLFRVVFGANYTLTSAELQDLVKQHVKDIQNSGVVAATCEADFKAISDHTRPLWRQSAEQLKAGFVQDLYALQGYRNMWYSGYAWCTPYSSPVWACVDRLIPKILADLDREEDG